MSFILLFFLTLLFSHSPLLASPPTTTLINPQLTMVGPRHLSLGITNPAISNDANGIFINPASIGYLNPTPFAITNQKTLGEIDVLVMHATLPFEIRLPFLAPHYKQKMSLGLSYGHNILDGIPTTILDQATIRPLSYGSSGFRLYQFTAGTEFNDIAGFDRFNAGVGLKYLEQSLFKKSRSTITLDLGIIATYYSDFWLVEQVTIGGSILNFLPQTLQWPDDLGSSTLPFQVFLGTRIDMLDNKLGVFLNNSITNFSIGAEYKLQRNLVLRGSTNFTTISMGTGLIIDKLAGFFDKKYNTRIDFNYTQNPGPFSSEPSYAFGLTVLGESKPYTPEILEPRDSQVVNSSKIALKGTGPANTTMRIYNNDKLTRTVTSDKYGHWLKKDFALKEGANTIFIKAYSLEKDESISSDILKITSDTSPPKLNVSISSKGNALLFEAKGNEILSSINGYYEDIALKFKKQKDKSWTAKVKIPEAFKDNTPPPEELSYVDITATDEAGNLSENNEIPFFIAVEYPINKSVHNTNSIRFIGRTSPLVDQVIINGSNAYIDDNDNFSVASFLKPGKNHITINVKTKTSELTHKTKILYLKTFDDIIGLKEKTEIEILTTWGMIFGDDDTTFNPEAPITRRYLAKLMVKNNNVDLEKLTEAPFNDVDLEDPDAPYFKAAIQNGYLYADLVGNFNPEASLTYSQVNTALANSGVIDAAQPLNERENTIMSRKDLAYFLAYIPANELRIERFIDWNLGYN